MLLKLILKIWPSFIPIFTYFFWIVIQNLISRYLSSRSLSKKNYIEGDFEELNKNGKNIKKAKIDHFSLNNKNFIVVIYLSLFLAIISFLFFALTQESNKEGTYTPAINKNGKITPGNIRR